MKINLDKLVGEYAKVQKFAKPASAQLSDDTWDEIDRLHRQRLQEKEKAKKLVTPRRP
jgi:hypothetical protein